MRIPDYGALLLVGAAALGVGFVNTHTDELLVVIPLVGLLSFVFGAGQPPRAWLWAFLLGGAVPCSQLVALLGGWHVPYPNDVNSIETSCIALGPALIAAYVGVGARRTVG
jgi:hypothetical protein